MSFDDLPPQPPYPRPAANTYLKEALARSRRAAESGRAVPDIPYGADYWQKIDIYLPDDPKLTRLPVVFALHGGGWSSGYKEMLGHMAPGVRQIPAILVSASYRLAPETKHPELARDCFRALRWVIDNIARHGGDPGNIFITGHSAGAHLAAMLALHEPLRREFAIKPGVIRACLPASGLYSLEFNNMVEGGAEHGWFTKLLARAEDAADASPLRFVAGNRTPFLVSYGENDIPPVLESTPVMIDALKQQPGPVETIVWKGGDHFAHLECCEPGNPWIAALKRYIQRYGASA